MIFIHFMVVSIFFFLHKIKSHFSNSSTLVQYSMHENSAKESYRLSLIGMKGKTNYFWVWRHLKYALPIGRFFFNLFTNTHALKFKHGTAFRLVRAREIRKWEETDYQWPKHSLPNNRSRSNQNTYIMFATSSGIWMKKYCYF